MRSPRLVPSRRRAGPGTVRERHPRPEYPVDEDPLLALARGLARKGQRSGDDQSPTRDPSPTTAIALRFSVESLLDSFDGFGEATQFVRYVEGCPWRALATRRRRARRPWE